MSYKRPTDYWCNDDEQVKIIEAALDLYEKSLRPEDARTVTQEMILAGMKARQDFMERCERDAIARGLSGDTYVYSNWQLIEEILKAVFEDKPLPQEQR